LVGVASVGIRVVIVLEPVQESSAFPYILAGFALAIALGSQFVNGFRDTANAVAAAAVIYTHSLRGQSARTAAVFTAPKAKGVRFAIDDFGTQHSNLDLLGGLQFDLLNIDLQFVSHVDTSGAGTSRTSSWPTGTAA
jgi:hypothetical protein